MAADPLSAGPLFASRSSPPLAFRIGHTGFGLGVGVGVGVGFGTPIDLRALPVVGQGLAVGLSQAGGLFSVRAFRSVAVVIAARHRPPFPNATSGRPRRLQCLRAPTGRQPRGQAFARQPCAPQSPCPSPSPSPPPVPLALGTTPVFAAAQGG